MANRRIPASKSRSFFRRIGPGTLLALVLTALRLDTAFAIDLNGDGMSDVWARKYSIPAEAASLDYTGDGLTNSQKSALGLDPRDPNSRFNVTIRWDGPPNELRLRFETKTGKQYQLESSLNLHDWTALGAVLVGDGNAVEIGTPRPPDGAVYFRGKFIGEMDADGDSLTAWEEREIGTSDTTPDSDTDGMPDAWEFRYDLDPLTNDAAGDVDGDGATNLQEYQNGTNPRYAPPALQVATASESAVYLSWTAAPFTGQWRIERSVDGVHWGIIATVAGTVSSYADSGLAAGTEYFYRVSATDGGPTVFEPSVVRAIAPSIVRRRYTVIDLGVSVEGSKPSGLAITNTGHVVVRAEYPGTDYLWRAGVSTAFSNFVPYDINDAGIVAGYIPGEWNGSHNTYGNRAAWWYDGSTHLLSDLLLTGPPGYEDGGYIANNSAALAINNIGDVVGWSRNQLNESIATKWNIVGSVSSIGSAGVPPFDFEEGNLAGSKATAVNIYGEAVGAVQGYRWGVGQDGRILSDVYVLSDRHIELAPLRLQITNTGAPNGDRALLPLAHINDLGEVVFRDRTVPMYAPAPVLTSGETPTWLRLPALQLNALQPPGMSLNLREVRQINNSGDAVVYDDDSGYFYLWNKGTKEQHTLTLIEPTDPAIEIWEINDLNDQGWLTGQAHFPSDHELHAVALVPAELVPDYNRDGKIDDQDRGHVTVENPYRFWMNDDDDDGATGGTGIPTGGGGNGIDTRINGMRDLVDFFPVYLDIKQLLVAFPADGFDYKLECADQFLNYLETDLAPTVSRDYLTKIDSNGEALDAAGPISNQPVRRIAAGHLLTSNFLEKISNAEKGVILVEAWGEISKPLTLSITKRESGTKVAELILELKITEVEKMYRHKNLMAADNASGGPPDYATGGDTEHAEPENLPDALCNDKTFVFVHGYNVNPEQARGSNARMFKSMWWSGSKAKFCGVTWHGSETQVNIGSISVTPNYHVNVDNAFATAASFATFTNSLGAGVTVAAHSLGNMVVASAIHDWNAQADVFYMLNAAVAIEAFDGRAAEEPLMAHEDWYQSGRPDNQNYAKRLWANEWHANPTFPNNDGRVQLTWRDRLSGIDRVTTYNFYSSGEEVLAGPDPATPNVIGYVGGQLFNTVFGDHPGGQKSWSLQEKLKGRAVTGEILGSSYGGWGFNVAWYVPRPDNSVRRLTPAEASEITDHQLGSAPFFVPGPSELHADGSASSYASSHRNTLLAEMIPAVTQAAGHIELLKLTEDAGEERNFNLMDLETGWPAERLASEAQGSRWLHGDLHAVAYSFTHRLFDRFCTLEGLDQ